ncbi:helix-turn-helix domain-containing protein [Streptomyces sp. NPDC019443]|uniref:helix-turn-helix domain-containing protein n=1 Tax=Streptomyces sp. NPDC019443 TaxID=3365061 RepID=UPI0037A9848C
MKLDGPAIARARRAQNMSLRKLQKLTGLDRGYLSRMERGLIRESADERVQSIADALQVTSDDITDKEKNVTAKATKTPPIAADENDLRRYTPEEVIDNRWLPYKSARVLREKAYKGEVHCHKDGGVISFTAEDIRKENDRHAVVPGQRKTRAA